MDLIFLDSKQRVVGGGDAMGIQFPTPTSDNTQTLSERLADAISVCQVNDYRSMVGRILVLLVPLSALHLQRYTHGIGKEQCLPAARSSSVGFHTELTRPF